MQIDEWADYIKEGRQYFKTARNGRKRKAVFTNEVTYNLICLSLEKLLIGLCMQRGQIPEDHTIRGIVATTNDLCPMDPVLMQEIDSMDRIHDMCSLEVQNFCTVQDGQIEGLLSLNERVEAFVDTHLQ